jgi:hypothetical protein
MPGEGAADSVTGPKVLKDLRHCSPECSGRYWLITRCLLKLLEELRYCQTYSSLDIATMTEKKGHIARTKVVCSRYRVSRIEINLKVNSIGSQYLS